MNLTIQFKNELAILRLQLLRGITLIRLRLLTGVVIECLTRTIRQNVFSAQITRQSQPHL